MANRILGSVAPGPKAADLKLDGTLAFVEHGSSPEPAIERWHHGLAHIWGHDAGDADIFNGNLDL